MDESIYRNLDSQHRILDEIERSLDAALADDESPALPAVTFDPAMTYSELTDANDALRLQRGWEDVDLYSALTPAQQERYESWLDSQRLPWARDDFMVLGLAGVVGAAATLFDTQLDGLVSDSLGKLKQSNLIKGWEADGRRLPIDYTGIGVGGPGHRVKSAGHDLARPLEALRQIREGVFRATAWLHGNQMSVEVSLSTWRTVDSWPEAMILWAKHLAADIVTPMSLPIPGFSKLNELDNQWVREFAYAAYEGPRPLGQGLNVRSGMLTPTLSVLSTEAIIRTHILARAYQTRGTLQLTAAERALHTEMLLAGHGLVGAVALGKSTAVLLLTENPAFAVRHINVPVLMRIATLGWSALQEQRRRATAAAPSWDDLLLEWARPWQLDAALEIEVEAKRLTLV
ncbi:hypothetical protein [Mycolicibacterium goodii]|uniref:hypothetical protein n=1 Tax=Mycolicibacterium goodii TaxID=134601 RepID=UPI001BDC3548|nr:hypothetical protein [Mycolicibacterium goodii]MBU8830542.1 hypothetical protein [Mycolicibacterium goodii]